MLKIPYGKSDFKTVMGENYFYQDRTNYIQTLEDWASTYLLYLRPRRFGKSLFLSTLHYYYGLQYQAEFQTIFGNTFIGKTPTHRANQYLILRFDFSGISTDNEQSTHHGFLSNILKGIGNFLELYSIFFTKDQTKEILTQKEPNEVLKMLLYHAYNRPNIPKIWIGHIWMCIWKRFEDKNHNLK